MPEVDPIPQDYPRVTPYLHVSGAAAAIDFYTDILGAEERMRMPGPDGKLGHAELQIGESIVMLSDEFPDMGARGLKSIGGTPVTLHVYLEDVDAVFDAALAAGATSLRPVENQCMEIAPRSSRIPSATGGTSPPTGRTCRPRRWRSGWRRR